MKPEPYRKVIRRLKRICRQNGIELTIESARGAGSHRALKFTDMKTGDHVRLILSGDRIISPGVQRHCLEYLVKMSPLIALAIRIAQIWRDTFNN